MWKQQQLITGHKGDCFRACMATILGIPIDLVPNFCVEEPSGWLEMAQGWVRPYGYCLLPVQFNPHMAKVLFETKPIGILSGLTERGFLHSVVCIGLEVVHDPHPEPVPFKADPEDVILFVNGVFAALAAATDLGV